MKRYILTLFVVILSNHSIQSQHHEEQIEKEAIMAVMNKQQEDWSERNLEGFMEGYWKSDSLKFYGSSGLTYGWKNTLENYRKRYPTKGHTGKLRFKINDISKIRDDSYFVMGEYYLSREMGDANGIFMIIFKKINGQWKIIADTSC